tara:strand:+ start:11645 stop:13999 length:2355 start_codon:yes stop_codon:yes gene_type:complete
MKTRTERAIAYCHAAGGAISGDQGHNHTLGVATAILRKIGIDSPDELMTILLEAHNPQCDPPWSEKELRHKVDEAFKLCAGQIGSEAGKAMRPGSVFDDGKVYNLKTSESELPEKHKGIRFKYRDIKYQPYPVDETGGYDDLQTPSNGALWIMSNAFRPEEYVRVATAFFNDAGRECPSGGGVVKTAKEWIALLSKYRGVWNKPGGMFAKQEDEIGPEGPPGVYIGINPYGQASTKDANISSYRHALLEFDDLDKRKQWDIIHQSNLPIACIIDSGKRSLHAWVKIDAQNRQEYDERVAVVYEYFSEYSPDRANKNPGRLSRAPEALRLDSEQRLISTSAGAGSFVEWLAEQAKAGTGESLDPEKLLAFDPERDPDCLIGSRWLCRGGSCVFVAQSGIGKSSMMAQAAFTWALGMPLFGITPARPLRSLIVQAENDMGDIAEQTQGVIAGMGFDIFQHRAQIDQIFANVKFHRDSINTSDKFCRAVSKLIEQQSPDLVWIDPLLSFLGGDVSKQEVCSKFLRNGLNPIAEATGATFMLIHHTGKPPKDSKAMSGWTANDYAYLGAGSSELTNWARAVVVITQTSDDNTYLMQLAKRGGRAGAVATDGNPTTKIHLAQATDGSIYWSQIDEPDWIANAQQPKQRGNDNEIPEAEIANSPVHATPTDASPRDPLQYWMDKYPAFDPYAALEPIWGRSGMKWSEVLETLTQYGRATGNGPSSDKLATALAKDIRAIVTIPGTDSPYLEMIEAPPKKEGGRTIKTFTVNRPDSIGAGEDFSDVPMMGE